MKAVIIKSQGVAALTDIKEPSMRPGYYKVKVVALAVNPTDLHHCAGIGPVGGILGCDMSGIVTEIGADCTTDVKKGDRVYGVCHGANMSCHEDGAFAEYAMVRDGHIAKIPENMSFQEAATLGVGITTVGQCLYMNMGFSLPGSEKPENPPFIFIYGGSSATGTLAIQFAKLSGLKVVTTASPANFELVKSRGADVVFDYNDEDCAKKVKDYTKNSLRYVLDCISTEASYKLIANALPESNEPAIQLVTLLPADAWPRKEITPTTIVGYTSFGESFTKFGIDFPPNSAHFEYGCKFWKLSNELLASGQIKSHPVALRKGGLRGIPDGLAEHGNGQVRAVKLVYALSETDDALGGGISAIKAPTFGSQW